MPIRWVHGIDALADYVALARDFSNREAVRSIRCPVFLAWEENDPLAALAAEVDVRLARPRAG